MLPTGMCSAALISAYECGGSTDLVDPGHLAQLAGVA